MTRHMISALLFAIVVSIAILVAQRDKRASVSWVTFILLFVVGFVFRLIIA